MTTDLEKQFFDTFGIEAKLKCSPMECPQMGLHGRDKCAKKLCRVDEDCWKYKQYTSAFYGYPQITDRILLELICFNNRHYVTLEDLICPKNIETIKESVLKKFIKRNKEFVDNGYSGFCLKTVQALVEEG